MQTKGAVERHLVIIGEAVKLLLYYRVHSLIMKSCLNYS